MGIVDWRLAHAPDKKLQLEKKKRALSSIQLAPITGPSASTTALGTSVLPSQQASMVVSAEDSGEDDGGDPRAAYKKHLIASRKEWLERTRIKPIEKRKTVK